MAFDKAATYAANSRVPAGDTLFRLAGIDAAAHDLKVLAGERTRLCTVSFN
jgi:hypothetical protein